MTIKRINLHGIDKEIRAVQKSLRGARAAASVADRKKIDLLVKKLEAVRSRTAMICPKAWSIWPGSTSTGGTKY